ncbi:unnamed protein product [Amaranthus hypochondriacus]
MMNSMTFAQLAAESRKKGAQAENTPLPAPQKNGKNKRLPEESHAVSSGATGSTGFPSTQPTKRQKPLPPKGDNNKKAAGASREKDKGKEKVIAGEEEYDSTVQEAAEEMKEFEALGPN